MRTKKLWNQIVSILLVIALLPVSALAELRPEDTAHPDVVNQPEFTVSVSHVNPEYERLGVTFPKPAADCMTTAQTSVDTMGEAAEYLREQMEDRVTEVTISVENYTYVDNNTLSADWKNILYGAFAHTGVPTQGDYIVRHYGQSGGSIGVSGSTVTFLFNIVYDTTLEQENAVGDKIDELFAAWDEEYGFDALSDYEQIKVIYDYICENVVYDYANLNDDSYMLKYSAYAALINGTSVCQGYANLFYRMALEAGIDNRIIIGYGNGGLHSWNIVDLGEKYYYLDATWDAPLAQIDYPYEYFLLGSDNFCVDHIPKANDSIDCDVTTYPIDTADYDPDTALLTEATEAGLLRYFDTVTMDTELTRLAFAKLCVVLKKIPLETEVTLPYTDCDTLTDEEKQIIATVIKHGIMTGFDDGTVRPFGTYTRAQTATLVYRVFDGLQIYNISDYADAGLFSDVENSAWYAPYVNYLSSIGVIATSEDGKFYPIDTADLRATLRWILNAMDLESENEPEIPEDAIASGECGENLTWTLTTDGTLTISGTGAMYDYGWDNRSPWSNNKDDIVSVVIENGATNIGNDAFYGCGNLVNIEIPHGVTSIGSDAFSGCSNLASIEIPDSVTTIGAWAFYGCSSLVSIEIPRAVTNIGSWAFESCYNLASIEIPDSVTTIGSYAFSGCRNLASVEIPHSVTRIGNGAFSGCMNLEAVSVSSDNLYYCDVDGILFNKDQTTLVCYPCGKTENAYVIPNSVNYIYADAFRNCDNLVSIEIPDSVTTIGWGAFFACTGLVSIEIPDGVISIEDYVFYWCNNLVSITIPSSVTIIGEAAFYYCTNLDTVYYGGTEEQWNAVVIGSDNEPLLDAEIIFEEDSVHTHTEETIPAIAPTCTESGLTEGVQCSECGEILVEQEVIPALGHEFDEGVVTTEPTCTESGIKTYICLREGCDHSFTESIPSTGHIDENGDDICDTCGDTLYTPQIVFASQSVTSGQTITVEITAVNMPAVKALMLKNFQYDSDMLEFVDAELNLGDAVIADWDSTDMIATVAFDENTDINGTILTLTFKVKEGVEGECSITCDVYVNQMQADGNETQVALSVVSSTIVVISYQRGDVNGDGYVNSNDSIYLLRYILTPNRYPINQSGDMNGDGYVNSNDAIYLLRHILTPSRYPLA